MSRNYGQMKVDELGEYIADLKKKISSSEGATAKRLCVQDLFRVRDYLEKVLSKMEVAE